MSVSGSGLEAFLAHLYTDADALAAFLADRESLLQRSELTEKEREALRRIDQTGLELVAKSFRRKRAMKQHSAKQIKGWFRTWIDQWRVFRGR